MAVDDSKISAPRAAKVFFITADAPKEIPLSPNNWPRVNKLGDWVAPTEKKMHLLPESSVFGPQNHG
jgi:hypothetical protein